MTVYNGTGTGVRAMPLPPMRIISNIHGGFSRKRTAFAEPRLDFPRAKIISGAYTSKKIRVRSVKLYYSVVCGSYNEPFFAFQTLVGIILLYE